MTDFPPPRESTFLAPWPSRLKAARRRATSAAGAGRTTPRTTRPPAPHRVLMVAPQPFFRVTGTPINVLMMCRVLTENGFEVRLLTLPDGEEVALPGLVLHRVARLPFANVPVGFSVAKVCYNLLLAGALLRLFATRRFAALHAIEEAAFWAVPIARLFRVPAITDLDSDLCWQLGEHRSALVRALAWPARWLRRGALRRSRVVFTVAHHMTQIARTESPATPVFKIHDIPIEEAIGRPAPARRTALCAALGLVDKRAVVYTGNYDHRQGLAELVRAMPTVRRRHPDAVLVVVGGEPHEVRSLQALVDELGIAASVRLVGQQPAATMVDYMGLAAVLVSPRLEPFATPLKIFSYMASGRPIVATDLPTHTQVLGPDAAILVPPTSQGLGLGIVHALDDPAAAARRAARARQLVRERHNYARFKRQLLDAYSAILAGSGATREGTPPDNEPTRSHGRMAGR